MSAGGPADSVYKSSEASPLGDLLARINQAPAVGRLATPLQDFLTKATTRLLYLHETEGTLWFNTAGKNCLPINVC